MDLLTRWGDEAKLLAGGQSLMPLLAFRLARPEILGDLNRVREVEDADLGTDPRGPGRPARAPSSGPWAPSPGTGRWSGRRCRTQSAKPSATSGTCRSATAAPSAAAWPT